MTISRDNALKSQITKLLASIQNKAVSDTPLDDKEKGFISSTTIPVFKYLVDPQMLGVSNSMIYQLTDYIGYDILLQYIQELIQQARAMVANQYLIAPVVAVIKQQGMWYYRGGCLSLSGSGKTQVPEMRRPHLLIH